MEIIENPTSTNFSVRNRDRSVNSEFVFVYARPRYGKSLIVESLIELYHKAGYTILCLSDVKDEWELGYAMFKPEKKYHLDRLKKDGIEPGQKNVKLYHPFTYAIPSGYLPDIQFYGFSLKELQRAELSIISESAWESDTTRILLNASSIISPNIGLYGFLHSIEGNITGKKKGRELRRDPKIFNLRVTGGTAKSLQDIASYFLPFDKHYFLLPDNSDLKLDWEKILNDNKNYHVFGSCYINDPKLKEFCILSLLKSIIRNRKKGKKPILIYIPEIRALTPYHPEGYMKFLAYEMKSTISIMGSMGKGGIAGVFDSQSFTDTDEDVRKSQTKTFFGEMSDRDIDVIAKSLRWNKNQIQPMIKSDAKRTSQPTFIYQGDVDMGSITPRFPSHCHAEEEYEFEELYKKHFRDKMKRYDDLKDRVKKIADEEKNRIDERIKREDRKEREEKERLKKEKEERKEKPEEKPSRLKEKDKENIQRNMKLAYEMYNDENVPKAERSYDKIADKLELSKTTIHNYIKKYNPEKSEEKITEENSEEKMFTD